MARLQRFGRWITGADEHVDDQDAAAPDQSPNWGVLAGATVAGGALLAFRLPPNTALFWYAFPLFGIGITYVVQFRRQFTWRWWTSFGVSAVLAPIALALDWAFSGHILWNVLFIGHALQTPPKRTWTVVLLASLVELFVLKILFQRPLDIVGGFVSLALGVVAVRLAGPPRRGIVGRQSKTAQQ